MAIQIVKRKNFSAPLPPDFYALKSLVRIDNGKYLVATRYADLHDSCAFFMIHEHKLYFSGKHNSLLVIKWFQKLKETWFPVRYRLEYISIDEHVMG